MASKTDPFLLEIQSRKQAEMPRILAHLSSSNESTLALAKDIAAFTYSQEREKANIIESRAFGLMQFAKVGLSIIIPIAGIISASNVHDTPFRESLIFLLSVAGAFLAKLFNRGLNVVKTGSFFRPHLDTYVKPSESDIYEAQDSANYTEALKQHIASMIWYFDNTANDNRDRIRHCKCCYLNSFGFLFSFLAFFVLSFVHLMNPAMTLILPAHRIIGICLLLLALTADNIAERLELGWFRIEPEVPRF